MTTTKGHHRKPRTRTRLPVVAGLAVLALAALGACSSAEDEPTTTFTSTSVSDGSTEPANEEILSAPANEPVETEPAEPEPTSEPEPEAEEAETSAIDNATVGETNALITAIEYLDFAGFSAESLRGQLEYEGYTASEIEFAMGQIAPDWKAEAVESAESYLDFTSFSRSGLIDQLLFEGFTQAQAEHAATTVGL